MADEDPCTWRGIACADGRVARIDLAKRALRGRLADEVGCPRLPGQAGAMKGGRKTCVGHGRVVKYRIGEY